jgi:hypothetical protein
MRTNVSVSAIAECPFSIAEDYAVDYLRRAEQGGDEATIRLPLVVSPAALHHQVKIGFGLHLDILEEGRQHDEVRFRWSSGTRFLPDFRGTLRFRIDGTRTEVLIDGSYGAPFGLLGRVFDRVCGRALAHQSLQDLANRLASYLGDRQRTWAGAVNLRHSITTK